MTNNTIFFFKRRRSTKHRYNFFLTIRNSTELHRDIEEFNSIGHAIEF